MQHRVGGRVKTVSHENFYPGLWSDGKYSHDVVVFGSARREISHTCIIV